MLAPERDCRADGVTHVRATEIIQLITDHRDEVVAHWMAKSAPLVEGELTRDQLLDSLHLFIDEILDGLSGGGGRLVAQQRSSLAREHGSQRQVLDQPLSMVIREYGLFLEAVVECAERHRRALPVGELLALSKCLYTGAAEAAEEFARVQTAARQQQGYRQFAFLAHELRNPLSSVRLGWESVRRTHSLASRTSDTVTRNLSKLTNLIDESLVQLRLDSVADGEAVERDPIDLDQLLHECRLDSEAEAEANRITIVIEAEPASLTGNHRLLRSAITNLLRNAVKFTGVQGCVHVRGRVSGARYAIEIEDECGGIPPDKIERVFDAFSQVGNDRSGFGLGLAIAKQAVQFHSGMISVRNVMPTGCVFLIDLPND